MGLQISCGVRAQAAAESNLRTDTAPSGIDFPWAGEAKGMPDSGRAFDARPRTYVHCDSTQAPSRIGDRVPEREESAIAIARLCGKERNFSGEHFWARGYAVSTVGFELEQVRQYIREQESADDNSGQF